MHAQSLVRDLSRVHGLPEEAIVVGNGSTALIYRLPYALTVRTALVLHPTFSEYERAFGLGGCRIDMVMRDEDGGFRPPWQRLFEGLRRGYGVVVLCNPNNPTGDVMAKEELAEFVEEAGRLGTVVVVDEAFMDFHEEATLKHEVLRRGNLLVLRSMTKVYALAGLRLGFLTASPPLAKRVREADEPWSVSALAQLAGRESLKDRNYLRRTLELIAAERHYLMEHLSVLSGLVVYPSVTNFLLVKITRPGWDAPRLQRELIRQGILIRDCRSFPGLGGGFMRLAVRGRKDNSQLIRALQQTFPS
jgi:threonine-phosphate decarboxylase